MSDFRAPGNFVFQSEQVTCAIGQIQNGIDGLGYQNALEAVMLAPNTLIQALNVISALQKVELHPFIQHCMRRLPSGVFLAHTYVLTDRAVACAKPAQRAAPDVPHRQVFQ